MIHHHTSPNTNQNCCAVVSLIPNELRPEQRLAENIPQGWTTRNGNHPHRLVVNLPRGKQALTGERWLVELAGSTDSIIFANAVSREMPAPEVPACIEAGQKLIVENEIDDYSLRLRRCGIVTDAFWQRHPGMESWLEVLFEEIHHEIIAQAPGDRLQPQPNQRLRLSGLHHFGGRDYGYLPDGRLVSFYRPYG